MPTLISIPAGSYKDNTLVISALPVPEGAASIGVVGYCDGWTDVDSTAVVTLEISRDGGETWDMAITGIFHGGFTEDTLPQYRTQTMFVGLPTGENNLHIRGSIAITGTYVTTGSLLVSI